MSETRKSGIRVLLEGIETGDPACVEVIHPDKYIQHNPQTQTGREGLAALFSRLSKGSPRVNSAFYDLFRIADRKLVEHWDTIEAVAPKSEWKHDNGKF